MGVPQIRPHVPDDDVGYIRLVNNLIANHLSEHRPHLLFVIRVKNWFDHKWLNFSGIGRVAYRGVFNHTALDTFYQDKITFPAFSPRRILSQHYARQVGTGVEFTALKPVIPIHPRVLRPSSYNLHRRISDFATSALFVWYCSRTAHNQRGCVMLYHLDESAVPSTCYYALGADREKASWRIERVKGTLDDLR